MRSHVSTPPHIMIEQLTVAFTQHVVLEALDLTVPARSALCLIGLSASGKTVLAKTIAGLIPPTTGHILIDSKNIHESDIQTQQTFMRRMGFLFQKSGLFDSLPIWKNITFQQLETHTWTQAEARAQAADLLNDVGLPSHVADLYPADLSGGMQKRVGIARALAGMPDLLILDEPTAGLDPIMSQAICDLVADLRTQRPMTVLAISSDMAVAQHMSDHIAMIHDRTVLWHGAAADAAHCGQPEVEQMLACSADGPLTL